MIVKIKLTRKSASTGLVKIILPKNVDGAGEGVSMNDTKRGGGGRKARDC